MGSFTDSDTGDTHSFVTTSNGGTLPSYITWDSSTKIWTFSGHVNTNQGNYAIVVTVTDNNSVGASGGVLTDTFSFTYTVRPINSAPTFDSAMADYTITVDDTYSYAISDISDVDPSDTHIFTVTWLGNASLPYFMTLTSLTLVISPDDNDYKGTYTIQVSVVDDNSVTDAAGVKTVVDTFVITLLPLNHVCSLNTVGITTTGFRYILGADQAIDLPTSYSDEDTNDSHRWEFYTGSGTSLNSWITSV